MYKSDFTLSNIATHRWTRCFSLKVIPESILDLCHLIEMYCSISPEEWNTFTLKDLFIAISALRTYWLKSNHQGSFCSSCRISGWASPRATKECLPWVVLGEQWIGRPQKFFACWTIFPVRNCKSNVCSNNHDFSTDHREVVSNRCDIFSAGCVVFYYVTRGKYHPFGDKFFLYMNILNGNPVYFLSEF